METLQEIKDFCQDEINEFSVLGYEPSKYQLGYNSAINDVKEIYEGVPDNSCQLEKLEADKAELLEALEKIYRIGNKPYRNTRNEEIEINRIAESLIQKHRK